MAESQTNAGRAEAESSDIKRKLLWRVGFAGVMIVLLLGTLAVFDRMNAPDDSEPAEPRFTEPVPVAKKEITQPVKPAEPAATVPQETSEPAAPEESAAPVDKSIALSAPPRPEVAAQPHVPRAEVRSTPSRPAAAAGRSEPAAAPHPQAEPAPPPAPRAAASPGVRLFAGYALQAGVFSDTRRAEELHAQLTLNGIPSTIESRVQVGPFKTREEAEAARVKMKALGIDALLLPPKGSARR